MKLGKIDIKILQELEIDSRQTNTQLAKNLDISASLLRHKLLALRKRGVIEGFFAIIDFFKLGYSLFRVTIRLSNMKKGKYEALLAYLMQHPNVQYLVEVGGKWDLIVNFMARNVFEFHYYLRKTEESFPREILNYNVFSVVNVMDLGRNYGIEMNIRSRNFYWFEKKFAVANLDRIDLEILNMISENARVSCTRMAKKIEISPHTVISRIAKMEKERILLKFVPQVDIAKTDLNAFKGLVTLQYLTEQKKEEIIAYLKSAANVVALIELIGPWHFELECEVASREAELEITRDFQDRFRDVIKEFEIMPLIKEYRNNFFPKDLISRQ